MFEKMFTTKMSPDGKKLQRRFELISSLSERKSKVLSVIITAAVAMVMSVVSVAAAAADDAMTDRYTISVTSGGEEIQLENEPYFADGTTYLPLREFLEKSGWVKNGENDITYNDGKISVMIDETHVYEMDVQRPRVSKKAGGGMKLTVTLNHGAVLSDEGITYIPYDYIRFIAHQQNVTNNSIKEIECLIWDKQNGGTSREPDYAESASGTVETEKLQSSHIF